MARQPAAAAGRSRKTAVVERLAQLYDQGLIPDGIVRSADIVRAMDDVGSDLSRANPANFFKDMLRKNPTANWPAALLARRLYARQAYGEQKIFQFFTPPAGVDPFADDIGMPDDFPITKVSSLTMDSLARSLGRNEETWLTQVVVNLGLIGQHLAVHSPDADRIKDLRFLQVGMKTQPEIDSVFVAEHIGADGGTENVFLTVEVKQRGERVLADQIREQVRKAFEETSRLRDREIGYVKPFAVNVVRREFEGRNEDLVYIREFEMISREDFDATWARERGANLVYEIPLMFAASSAYALRPAIGALGR